MTATTLFIDVARYQRGLNMADVKRQGYAGVIIKCTEGRSFVSPTYSEQLADAKRAGLGIGVYHWLWDDSSASDQAANLARAIGDKSLPVIIDCEPVKDKTGHVISRPTMKHVTGFVAACAERGLNVRARGLYLPKWYWSQIGQPSLKGWTLWQSAYGANPVGRGAAIYPGNDSDRWAPFGGVTPTLLQFGSRGRIDGFGEDVDVNAFRGTLAELATLDLFAGLNPPNQEDDMANYRDWAAEDKKELAKDVANELLWRDVFKDNRKMTLSKAIQLIGQKLGDVPTEGDDQEGDPQA